VLRLPLCEILARHRAVQLLELGVQAGAVGLTQSAVDPVTDVVEREEVAVHRGPVTRRRVDK
jgi:hypothetical protein